MKVSVKPVISSMFSKYATIHGVHSRQALYPSSLTRRKKDNIPSTKDEYDF